MTEKEVLELADYFAIPDDQMNNFRYKLAILDDIYKNRLENIIKQYSIRDFKKVFAYLLDKNKKAVNAETLQQEAKKIIHTVIEAIEYNLQKYYFQSRPDLRTPLIPFDSEHCEKLTKEYPEFIVKVNGSLWVRDYGAINAVIISLLEKTRDTAVIVTDSDGRTITRTIDADLLGIVLSDAFTPELPDIEESIYSNEYAIKRETLKNDVETLKIYENAILHQLFHETMQKGIREVVTGIVPVIPKYVKRMADRWKETKVLFREAVEKLQK